MDTASASLGVSTLVTRVLWPNRPLGEHIRLAFELFILIQIFQRAEQIVGRIILEQRPDHFSVVDQTVFCGKRVIGRIQFACVALMSSSG